MKKKTWTVCFTRQMLFDCRPQTEFKTFLFLLQPSSPSSTLSSFGEHKQHHPHIPPWTEFSSQKHHLKIVHGDEPCWSPFLERCPRLKQEQCWSEAAAGGWISSSSGLDLQLTRGWGCFPLYTMSHQYHTWTLAIMPSWWKDIKTFSRCAINKAMSPIRHRETAGSNLFSFYHLELDKYVLDKRRSSRLWTFCKNQ